MPTTRRSTGSTKSRTGPTKGQSTLTFHNKVTKNVTSDVKKAIVSPPISKVEPPTVEDEVEVVDPEDEQEQSEEEPVEEPEAEPEVPQKSEAELKAEKITESQIEKYWKSIEKERIAPRIHQQGISTHEKILRYFDVSSQYGVSSPKCQLMKTCFARSMYLTDTEYFISLALVSHDQNAGIVLKSLD